MFNQARSFFLALQNWSSNLPWLHNFTGKQLGLETFEANLPQLLTSTSPAPVKPDPVRATNASPIQNLHAKERHSLLQVKKQNPASSCTIIYTPVTSNHIAKSLSKQKSEHNTTKGRSSSKLFSRRTRLIFFHIYFVSQ